MLIKYAVLFAVDVGGYVVYIVVCFDVGIHKICRKRLYFFLVQQLHYHIVGRAYKVVYVAEIELVIQVFVGAEGGVFHAHVEAVILRIEPFGEVVNHAVHAHYIIFAGIGVFHVDCFVVAPVAEVDVLFPVGYAQNNRFVGVGAACKRKYGCGKQAGGGNGRNSNLLHMRSSVFFFFLPETTFISTTIITTITKITVESAHSAVLISVWPPLVAFTT